MRPTLAVTSRTGHGVRLSATPADIEKVRRPVREREPDERLPPFRVVRVRSLDPRAVRAVDRELAVAGLRDDVRPGHELLTRDAIRPPPSPSPPRGPRSPSESRGPTSTPLSSRSPRSAPRSSREGPANSMRAEKRIALDRRNYRGKTINVNPSPA